MYLEFFLDTTIFIHFRSSFNLIIKLSDYFLLPNLLRMSLVAAINIAVL